jgi:hypothetical protein
MGTISPTKINDGARKSAADTAAARLPRVASKTVSSAQVADITAAAGVVAGKPPRINAAVISGKLRNPM